MAASSNDPNLATTYSLIYTFLTKREHTKAAEALKKAAKDVAKLDDASSDLPPLDQVVREWKELKHPGTTEDAVKKKVTNKKPSSSSSSDSSSDSDSSSRQARPPLMTNPTAPALIPTPLKRARSRTKSRSSLRKRKRQLLLPQATL
ncbi:hypothetical protein K474DRAFT_1434484 [Panus rudis PR-1116 ss-1]|nr:hypothetical protein K474DRAFT_1434484 [Panus rudis PR-1116 ss-1]